MNYTILLFPVVLPVIFWAWYHYNKDRSLPEPLGHLALAFTLGIVSFYLAGLFYQALGLINLRYDAFLLAETNPLGLLAYSVLAIGPIEEMAKMIPFLLVVIRFKEFNEPIDGIIYASFISLGFAAMENIRYVHSLTEYHALARGFVGPVVHIVFASIWGYYIGRAFQSKKYLGPMIFAAFVFSATIHGLYDFVVIGLPVIYLPIAAGLIVGLWVWRLVLIRDLHLQPGQPCPEDQI